MNDTRERLQRIARDIFDNPGLLLTEATAARDVPGWDSLAHVNFVFSVEEEFDVQLSEDEFAGFATIGELERMLDAKLRN